MSSLQPHFRHAGHKTTYFQETSSASRQVEAGFSLPSCWGDDCSLAAPRHLYNGLWWWEICKIFQQKEPTPSFSRSISSSRAGHVRRGVFLLFDLAGLIHSPRRHLEPCARKHPAALDTVIFFLKRIYIPLIVSIPVFLKSHFIEKTYVLQCVNRCVNGLHVHFSSPDAEWRVIYIPTVWNRVK